MEPQYRHNEPSLFHHKHTNGIFHGHRFEQGKSHHQCLWATEPTRQRNIPEKNKPYQDAFEYAQLGPGRSLQDDPNVVGENYWN